METASTSTTLWRNNNFIASQLQTARQILDIARGEEKNQTGYSSIHN